MSLKHGQARWAFNLNTWRPAFDDLLIATSCIQPEEKLRLAKFVYIDDFLASLAGRLLMRKFVYSATGIPYNEIRFYRDSKGKPYVAEQVINKKPDLYIDFNVSHQGSYSILGGLVEVKKKIDSVVLDSEKLKPTIGVDVMKIEYNGGKPLSEFFRIMHRNFSSHEWSIIKQSADNHSQLTAFMRNWCLKESYVKNIGVGITTNLEKISFKVSEPLQKTTVTTSTKVEVDGSIQKNWIFEESLLDDDHIAVVSIADNEPQNTEMNFFETISYEDLIKDCKPVTESDKDYVELVIKKERKL